MNKKGKLNLAIYPGTFDPLTNGHLDIIKRAISIFGQIVVAVVEQPAKQPLFSYKQRLAIVRQATQGLSGVTVEGFSGLVVDFVRKKKATVIVRGIRMISDFEYEFQMALTNRNLATQIETIFLMPQPQYSFISSRLIKEAAGLGGDLSHFLPQAAMKALKEKLK